jgi:4-amino-4-deoxy-L-arabinose transferase-like glycosyltransferase
VLAERPRAVAVAPITKPSPRSPARASRLHLGLLSGLVLAIIALDLLWVSEETRPPHWDMAAHLGSSLVYLHDFSLVHPLRPILAYTYYPPFVYWVTDAFYAVLGNEAIWVAVLSNVVFLAILVFATYGLGARLWSRRTGVLSAFFVVTTPMMVTAFKEYMLDAPLAAMVALALYVLVVCDRFARRSSSIAFGAVCGAGLLTEWTFPIAVALPAVVMAGAAVAAARRERSPRRVVNIAWALTATLLIAGPWYSGNLVTLRAELGDRNEPYAVASHLPPVLSRASFEWYFWSLVGNQLYLVPFLFLVTGVVFLFLRREAARRNLIPTLTVVGTYVGCTLIANKDARHADLWLPAIAILATSWLDFLRRPARAILVAAIVTYGTVAFLAISFGTSLLPKNVAVDTKATPFGAVTLFAQHGYIIGPPTRENWHQQQLVRIVAAAPPGSRSLTFRGPETIWFNAWDLWYASQRYRVPLVKSFDAADYVIVRGDGRRPPAASFERIRRFPLPEGGTVELYRRV